MAFRSLYLFGATMILYILGCLHFEPVFCLPLNPFLSFLNNIFKPLTGSSNTEALTAPQRALSPSFIPNVPNGINPGTSIRASFSNTRITFGGQAVPILDKNICEIREKNLPYNEYTLISSFKQYGLVLGTMMDVCTIHIQSEKQAVGKLSQATLSFNPQNPSQSNALVLDAVERIFTDLGWKYNLFFFQISCPQQIFCFRRLLRDDTDPNFGAWMQALDANAMAITQASKGSAFYVSNSAANEFGNLKELYTSAKSEYLSHVGDEIALLKYLNVLVWTDTVKGT